MRWGKVAFALCACACALWFAFQAAPEAVEAWEDGQVAEECQEGANFEAVEELGAGAWVSVEGTRVSYPVMQADASDPFFYLRRGTDGEPRASGSIFVDHRTRADAPHVLLYGHHMGNTGRMFSDLSHTWRQEGLSGIGEATLTVDGVPRVYEPLFAMRVDQSFEPVQRFGDDVDVPGLLAMVGSVASSAREGWQATASLCDGMLTLVTCSEDEVGQRWRCVTVFGHVAEAPEAGVEADEGTVAA